MTDRGTFITKFNVWDLLFRIGNYTLNSLFAFICIYPFYYLVLVSISDSNAVSRGEVILFPVHVNFLYYKEVFALQGILPALFISVSRSILGTLIAVFFTAMLAYILTKKEFKWRKFIYRMTVFTMYTSAGLIPWVVTMTYLGLQNNFLLYILPGGVSAFGVVLIKTYIEQAISPSIEESAIIDGAGYFTVFTKMIIPLAKPVIAAIAVFVAVGQWNTFTDNYFLVQNHHLQTMQLMLYNYLQSAERLSTAASAGNFSLFQSSGLTPPSPYTIKAAISVVTVVPILFVYPMLQKYFVKGIMLGAVKG